ncbi:MAG: hypothetical protein M1546_17830 [Chloroflexi bacterium]|nr:hypothetical protein [Chloroflexota bacterium]
MTGIATALRDAIQQTLDGKLGGSALLRQLIAHDEWRVPITIDDGGTSHYLYVKNSDGQRFQFLCTDEPAYQASHAAVGEALMGNRYMTARGIDLFADLSDDADVIAVNWGSPPEIFFKQEQIPSLREWAQTVRVEQTLATPKPDLRLLKAFARFYIVLQKVEEGFALTLAPDRHGRKLAAVFTAEDTLQAFLTDTRNGELGFEPVTRAIPGEHLFDDLREMPLDGIAFNCSGPVRTRLFTPELAKAVMSA